MKLITLLKNSLRLVNYGKNREGEEKKTSQPPLIHEENYDKILYYSDEDAYDEACELLDSSKNDFHL